MNESSPIATYREKRFDGARVFELFPDAVRIRGSVQLTSEFELSVPLAALDPHPMRLRIRHKGFWGGFWLLAGAVMLDFLLLGSFRVPPESFAILLIGCFGMGGFVLMLATARKIEFVTFANTAGIRVLDFARSGPEAGKLDAFIEQVVRQITCCSKGTP